MIEIPLKLQKLYFTKVIAKTKAAFEEGWQLKRHKYKDVEPWVKGGGNYGIHCVDGTIGIDFDDVTFWEDQNHFFPETFTDKTPKKGFHLIYQCHDIDGKATIHNKEGKQVGEIRCAGQQLIGPGSIHPDTLTAYIVHKDYDIATVSWKELSVCFGQYEIRFSKEKVVGDVKKFETDGKIFNLIKDLKLTQKGDELCGDHPIHGSSTGNNFSVDVKNNEWYCFRHNVGGGILQLIAILEGIVECADCNIKLRGTKLKHVKEIANVKYGINIKEAEKEHTLELAEEFIKHNCVRYSEENNMFYIYQNNYYQPISEGDLDRMMLELDGWKKLSVPKLNECKKRIQVLTLCAQCQILTSPHLAKTSLSQFGHFAFSLGLDSIFNPSLIAYIISNLFHVQF